MGMSERKELAPNAVAVVAVCGGDQRMQLRAGAGRAISLCDGISNGCVDVYVRCCIFLLKRTPADAEPGRDAREDGMGACSGSGRLSATEGVRGLDPAVGAGASSEASVGAESADSSGAKRFACCSGAIMRLRVVRCDAMRQWCEECGEDGCDDGTYDAAADASASVGGV